MALGRSGWTGWHRGWRIGQSQTRPSTSKPVSSCSVAPTGGLRGAPKRSAKRLPPSGSSATERSPVSRPTPTAPKHSKRWGWRTRGLEGLGTVAKDLDAAQLFASQRVDVENRLGQGDAALGLERHMQRSEHATI